MLASMLSRYPPPQLQGSVRRYDTLVNEEGKGYRTYVTTQDFQALPRYFVTCAPPRSVD